MTLSNISVLYEIPSVKTYRRLRSLAGLSPKSEEASLSGLKGTIFAVQIAHKNDIIAMGRLIGDGGCHFQVVDIAVLPQFQGMGFGKRIIDEIVYYIRHNLPHTAYVSLIADVTARKLYENFGFRPTAPNSIGMYLKVKKS
jgi:ribosomal protein S18 acetylase RimI-like enzyme